MISPRHPPTPQRVVRVGLLIVAGALAALALWHWAKTPADQSLALPGCPTWSLCGVHCSGCGMTRAARAAFSGDLPQMIAYNAFSPLAFPLLVFVFGRNAWRWAWGAPPPARAGRTHPLVWVLVGLVMTYGVVRNLPWYPFTMLAPHELDRGPDSP